LFIRVRLIRYFNSYFKIGMTKHTFLPTSNVEASQKEYLIASKLMLSFLGRLKIKHIDSL